MKMRIKITCFDLAEDFTSIMDRAGAQYERHFGSQEHGLMISFVRVKVYFKERMWHRDYVFDVEPIPQEEEDE